MTIFYITGTGCEKMRIVKAQRILVLILLIAVCSLGYWIGYISSKPTEAGNLHQQLQELVVNSIHHDEVLQSNKIKVVDEPHIKHVQGIHKAHIAHIKDHLHPEIHPETKPNNTVPKKVGVRPLKEEEPGGVEWEHIQKQKEEADNPVKAKPAPVTPKMAKFDISDPFYAVIHSGVATRVHGKIHEKLQTLPDTIQKEAYIFEADKYVVSSFFLFLCFFFPLSLLFSTISFCVELNIFKKAIRFWL